MENKRLQKTERDIQIWIEQAKQVFCLKETHMYIHNSIQLRIYQQIYEDSHIYTETITQVNVYRKITYTQRHSLTDVQAHGYTQIRIITLKHVYMHT